MQYLFREPSRFLALYGRRVGGFCVTAQLNGFGLCARKKEQNHA